MASFRTGFKIFGEISLKQGLGRIRSFSEDRKPGQWLPEDQWAVRQPGSTCPDPCEKPKKPPKPSKSWLSICKDPEPPIECDVRHNNCPSPPVKGDAPWYSLDNLIPKKKSEKTPPLQSCREEMKRREAQGEEEEVCENIVDKTFQVNIKPELPECCMPKREPCPAPVVTLSCPLPKELDIMLWCGRPCTDTSRIAAKCQSDKLPYQEFRPQRSWKPPPFSLPVKGDPTAFSSPSCTSSIAYSEFKQVEVPKPLYTRYKSVELSDSNLLLCMTEIKCPDDETTTVPVRTPPPLPPPPRQAAAPPEPEERLDPCPEKPVIEAASGRPVKISKAPKYGFRPKPTKLVEKRVFRNPCAQHKTCNLQFRPPEEKKPSPPPYNPKTCEPPKVITGTLTSEPQTFERNLAVNCHPPKWMYIICKPGSKESPLMPPPPEHPKEPDWCSETDGLKFYDENNEGITPKPPPDPCLAKPAKVEAQPPEPQPAPVECPPPVPEFRNRFVLMPDIYNIKNMRPEEQTEVADESFTFEKFIEAKTAAKKKCSKSYPQMKENILYDLQRLCPNLPLDRSKINAPCRKPPEPACPRPPSFFRSFATFTPSTLQNLCSVQPCRPPRRMECGDTSGKCKPRDMTPKPKPCPEEKPKPTCADIALPCCPKAKVPPNCDIKKPMPPCKKKLPPKPSFSECSKDPPPCPKMTECNCWEKVGGKNRKFSDWAAKRAEFDVRQSKEDGKAKGVEQETPNSRNSRLGKYSSSRSQYAGKVKCYTLKSVHPPHNAAGNKLMLGLKDPKVDSYCEYEQRSVVTKQKRPAIDVQHREYSGNTRSRPKRPAEHHPTNVALQTHFTSTDPCDVMAPGTVTCGQVMAPSNVPCGQMMPPGRGQVFKTGKGADEGKENSVTLYSSEENEENSKAFMGSIGSWINDLFNVPNKRLCTAPISDKDENRKESVLEEDAEYLKSITAIKEQFRKKLRSETSVHLSTAERPFEFHFDKVLENNRKPRKRVRSLPTPNSPEWLEELAGLTFCESVDTTAAEKSARGNNVTSGLLNIRTNDKEATPQPVNNNTFILSSSNLVKKKRRVTHKSRSEVSKLEEYVLPSPAELSKRILLNINDQEKCLQFYKNPHLGVQEAQHYGPRKGKPCQSNTRCYTTNANVTDSPENSRSKTFMTINRHSHYFTGDASDIKGEDEILPHKSPLDFKKPALRKGKNVSELSRDTLSFAKLKPAKPMLYPQMDNLKNDPKASSDELVKYLMKKIKVSTRPQQKKKFATNMPQVLSSPKTRFMQSATNTLVMSVMAKKENDVQAAVKPRTSPDNKLMKSGFPGKELMVKYPDNIRFDVSRALNYNKFNKSSYLLEDDRTEDEAFFGKANYKNAKRPYDDVLKKDSKKNDKITKRQEVKHMLSKIDMKFNVLNTAKLKPKELKKKVVKNMLDELDMEENKETSNPRFLKQHELFKNNIKSTQQSPEPASDRSKPEEAPTPPATSLSTELALINPDMQLTLANLQEKNIVVAEQPEQTPPEEPENNKISELLSLEEPPPSPKAEKNPPPLKTNLYREKLSKTKSQMFMKENDSQSLLNALPEYYGSELEDQNEASKPCEPPICPPDLRPMKSMDTLLLNRRYSTKILSENNRRGKVAALLSGPRHPPQKYASLVTGLGKDAEDEKKEAKEKKKVKPPKTIGADEHAIDSACGFEKIKKKPGPNCEANETSTP